MRAPQACSKNQGQVELLPCPRCVELMKISAAPHCITGRPVGKSLRILKRQTASIPSNFTPQLDRSYSDEQVLEES
jgi:hypothetical protein